MTQEVGRLVPRYDNPNPEKLVLGICGGIGAGKTTLATILRPLGWHRVRFAGPLKEMLIGFLLGQGVDPKVAQDLIDGDLKERPSEFFENRTPRRTMQTLGTEWGRHLIGPRFWSNAWKRQVLRTPGKVLADDLRFHTEVEAIRDLGGKIIRIIRPGTSIAGAAEHISEAEALTLQVDAEIINDSTPEKMLDKLADIMLYWK